MFTQILVALDGSELSEKALPVARNLANSSGGTIHLIQAVSRQPELEAAQSTGDFNPQLVEVSQDLARRLIETRLTHGREYLDRIYFYGMLNEKFRWRQERSYDEGETWQIWVKVDSV